MRNTHRLIALSLLLFAAAARAVDSDESLCLNPPAGVTCLAAEALNDDSHDGGNTTWEWGLAGWSGNPRYDMDDSSNTTEVYPRLGGFAENFCQNTPGMQPVSAASEAAFLPFGHTNSWVMRHRGVGNACHISHPRVTFDKSTGTTFCIRHYRRWAGTGLPGPIAGSPSGEPQQKIMTLGGYVNVNLNGNEVRHQFSVTPETDGIVGRIGWSADILQAGLATGAAANVATIPDDCQNNYCRFESCLDYSTSGNVHARARITEVSPGTGEQRTFSSTDGAGHDGNFPATWILTGTDNATGAVFDGQDIPNIIDYAAYVIFLKASTEQPNFWPGAAVEFEGSAGNPPNVHHISGRRMPIP